ncbi:PVC-type heme-binding CxxCH protein [Emticicia fluvialis]|uniref:PVC-type heme-binding CxxCH protein n=1 Tax=Emticicia fluvialis TaxID=2974474 RepID=UPI002166A647|nr:PVC-type heme-binding CxxCH protein [Emticicia fluvialis]
MRYLSIILVWLLFACEQKPQKALSPEHQKALASLTVMDGFKVEMVAAEPLIADPVAMEIDEDGNMYVVEMHGYPLDLSNSGKVKLLKDTDNDGVPDTSIVFADKLKLPTGIMRWKKGILVTDTPDIIYLEDSNNDGKADIRKVVLTGFALSNPQHNLNTPRFELDNWIYLGHEAIVTPFVYKKEFGDEGKDIYFADKPDGQHLGKNANGRAVRFNLDSYQVEELSGETQFGHTVDAWGHRLYTSNADHLFHEVLAAPYMKNNPDLLLPTATHDISDHGNAAEIYPITENPNHQLLTDVGVITSSCGVTWYLGGAFGDKFKDVTFVGEPVHNMVHADVIKQAGASFIASRLNEKSEFLASKDAWFRPVNFYIGPDGALYVIDYYRQIIEHPEWMSDEINKSGALYNGTDKGRIYRIVPENGLPMDWLGKLNLSKKSDAELVKLLENDNIWYRRTAQRLLLHRQAKGIAGNLREIIGKSALPEAKVHALWLLDGLKTVDVQDIIQTFRDGEAGVRENGIRVAENYMSRNPAGANTEKLKKELIALQNDGNNKVRFQLLNTLGFVKTPASEQARLAILKRDFHDKWVGVACIASFAGKENQVFDFAVKELAAEKSNETAEFFSNLGATIANSGNKEVFTAVFARVSTSNGNSDADWWKAATLSGISKLWHYKGITVPLADAQKEQLLTAFSAQSTAEYRKACLDLLEATGLPRSAEVTAKIKEAGVILSDKKQDEKLRADAVELLSIANASAYKNEFLQILTRKEPELVQVTVLNTLSKIGDKSTFDFLLKEFKTFSAPIQQKVVELLMAKPERIPLLLSALETKRIDKAAIGWRQMVDLMNYEETNIRAFARKVLAVNEDRKAVLQNYLKALDTKGDKTNGKLVFEKNCATCHQIEGVNGVNFGPNLSTLRSRNATSIITEIINPNNSIADKYDFWTLTFKNNNTMAGLILQENANVLTLREVGGKESVIQKKDIAKMVKSETSIMPNGLENAISIKEMADLIAFIQNK